MAKDHCAGHTGPENPPGTPGTSADSARHRLAVNLRVLRMLRGWSQEALAEAAQVDRSYVGGIERAERSAGLDCLERLARAFDLTVPDLLQPLNTQAIGERLLARIRTKAHTG